ncbi:MAG TPA: peptidylprolyl isomerase [Pyrinomonadaceae bacterium]|nr:peptidylprolyl isomerase [Pyrinomonadaceae bacterium]
MTTHTIRPILALLALCASLVACDKRAPSQTNSTSTALSLPPTVATVNGRPISSKLYEMYLKNGQETLGIDTSTEDGRRTLEQLKEGIVSELIDRTLISQEAESRGLQIPAEKLAEAERKTIAQFGGDKKYDEYLAGYHLTRDEYREVVKMEMYGEMMREELKKGVTVSDAEIKAFYDAHRDDTVMQRQERVTAAHILVSARPSLITQELQREKDLTGEDLTKAVREEMERRRARAEELRRKATSGVDFAALARQFSDDPSSRERGGDLGSFTRDSHARAFDDAAFSLKPGAISPVVQTDFGFHVIKVSAREPTRLLTLAEATPDIRKQLLEQREAGKLNDWLKETRRRAAIRISEPFRFGKLREEFPAA